MKQCMKPHALLHTVGGAGAGLILANWFNGLTGQVGIIIGLFVLLGSFIGELYLAGGKKR